MVDLDSFKRFNDSNGHQAGDVILKSAAVIWRDALRATDLLARYGGEEFVVIMPDTDIAQGIIALERLRAATPPPLTCSIGLAKWDGAKTCNGLLGRADQLLYSAKDAGRDRLAS